MEHGLLEHRFAKSVLFVHSSLDDAGLTANEFRVYCHLARRAGTAGDAFPSAQTVADVCRMHKDTVWEVLRSLEARGMVQRQPRPGLSTIYVLTTPDQWKKQGNPPETKGHPFDSPTGNEGPPPTGIGGVGPTGNEGVRRYSTEVTPPKSIPKQQRGREEDASGRMSANDWEPLREHRDLCAIRRADCDLQLARFRERNVGTLDTDQGWSVRFSQWIGRSRPERSVPPEAVASPTLDEWMAYAREVSRGKGPNGEAWPKPLAEAGWHENQAKGWKFVQDWKADCNSRALRWSGYEETNVQRTRRGR